MYNNTKRNTERSFGLWHTRLRDAKVRERLLRESNLTLQKTDEICRAAKSTSQQLKLVEPQEIAIHSVRKTTEVDVWTKTLIPYKRPI